jgi:lipoprotein signal peptidase
MNFLKDRPYYWLFGILALIGLVADQASKYVVFAKLYPADEHEWETKFEVIPDAFALRTTYLHGSHAADQPLSFLRTISGVRMPHLNRGALFGIGNHESETEGWNNFFAVVSLSAAVFILFWASRPNVAQDRFLNIALGLILGGTLGNLYDRVVFGGVRDFLHWYAGYNWPDFNIADSCLVCGACILFVHSFFVRDKEEEPAKAMAGATDTAATLPTYSA